MLRRSYYGVNNPKWRGGKNTFSCTYCGSQFQKYVCELKGHRPFCSKRCFDKYRIKPIINTRTPASEMHHEKHPRWSGIKFCKTCGIELRERCQRRRMYCSDYCCQNRVNARKSGKEHPSWRFDIERFCNNCGKEITRTKSRANASCCSMECANVWRSKNFSGRNSHLWKEHKAHDDYPPEWNAVLRHSIRVRDGFKCRACGFKEERLEIHHIDLNKMNCHESNLITLCASCHRSIHMQLRWDIKKGVRWNNQN